MILRHIRPLAIAVCAALVGAHAWAADKLRVCADPDNLPFSKSEGPEKGLYVDLADLVAKRLGSEVEFVWWLTYNERRALRNTILADGCDAVFALPADADYKVRGLMKSRAFIDVSYAVVTPPGVTVGRIEDLKGKRVAVQFGTVPQIWFATHEGYATTTYQTSEELLAVLAKGEVDAAFVWGPVGGYENLRHHGGKFTLTPVSGEGLGGPVAVAVRKGNEALLAAIDKALAELQPAIATLAEKYGFPRGQALALSRGEPAAGRDWAAGGIERSRAAARAGFVRVGDYGSGGADAADAAKGDAAAGRVKFNDTCSHCHSVDGASPLSERDLRRLLRRYDAKWPEVAEKTIKEGRSELGMPTWKDVLAPQDLKNILAFLVTIQKQ